MSDRFILFSTTLLKDASHLPRALSNDQWNDKIVRRKAVANFNRFQLFHSDKEFFRVSSRRFVETRFYLHIISSAKAETYSPIHTYLMKIVAGTCQHIVRLLTRL